MRRGLIVLCFALLVPLVGSAFSVNWGEQTINQLVESARKNEQTPGFTGAEWRQREIWIQVLEGQGNYLLSVSRELREALNSSNSILACLELKNNLGLGSTDARTNGDVSKLQRFLNQYGFFPTASGTGYYGEQTAQAVLKFQRAAGITYTTTRSGVGPTTRALIRDYCKTHSPYTSVYNGVYGYSDMSGFASFIAQIGPDGNPANIIWGTVEGNKMLASDPSLRDILENITPVGDSCTVERRVEIELRDVRSTGADAQGRGLWHGDYVRVVSRDNKVYDVCVAYVNGATTTERKERIAR